MLTSDRSVTPAIMGIIARTTQAALSMPEEAEAVVPRGMAASPAGDGSVDPIPLVEVLGGRD